MKNNDMKDERILRLMPVLKKEVTKEEFEIEYKKTQIWVLSFEVCNRIVDLFLDTDSKEMLDEKIEVLTSLKNGKKISEIPNFYKVLELYPKNTDEKIVLWD